MRLFIGDGQMTEKRRSEYRLWYLGVLMVASVLLLVGLTLFVLYKDAMSHERVRLQETVEGQRQFIEAIGRFAMEHTSKMNEASSPLKMALTQVIDARKAFVEMHAHSEFVLGMYRDGAIWLIVNNRDLLNNGTYVEPDRGTVTMLQPNAHFGIPMQLAMKGESGSIIARDYRNVEVVAAYTPVVIGDQTLGLVSKVDRTYVLKSFKQTAWSVGLITVVLLLIALLMFRQLAYPIIGELKTRLREYRRLANEREEIQQELMSQERQLRSLIENIPGGTFRYDMDAGKTVYISEQIEELTGYSSEEFYEDTLGCLFKLLGEETFRRRVQALDVLMNNVQYVLDYPLTKRNGKTIWVREHGQQIYDPVNNIHWLDGVIFDITVERLTQEQLNRRVEEGIQELREKDEVLLHNARLAAMGEMIGMIAHQWRQPIAGVGMIVNNLLLDIELGSLEPEKSREELYLIEEQLQYLSQTIEDFTNFFKPKSELERCSVKELIDDALKIIGKSLAHSDVEVLRSVKEDATVEIYKSEMIQVVLNLLKNAQDVFKEEARSDGVIEIESYHENGRTVIAVEDNAGGISEEILSKIFDPYFSTKHEKSGTGIGLYMSKMIVEDHHHGEIRVRNSERGARFEVVI